MINAEKLNNSIEEIERQIEHIKSITELSARLEKIACELGESKDIQIRSGEDILKATEILKTSTLQYSNQLQEMKEKVMNIDKGIYNRIDEINSTNSRFIDNLSREYRQFHSDVINNILLLSSENKKLYLETEQVLSSKLDRHKSDIEVEITNVNKQSQKSVERVLEHQKEALEKLIGDKFSENEKRSKSTLIIVGIFAGISFINLMLSIIMFFTGQS